MMLANHVLTVLKGAPRIFASRNLNVGAAMPVNKRYLQNVYDAFIGSSIQRVARSGDQVYQFEIPAEDIKKAFNVERLREPTVEEVQNFFARKNVRAEYEQGEGFQVTVDLNRASLGPADARNLAIALEVESAR